MDGDKPVIESTGGLLNPHVTMPSDSMYWRVPSLCRMSKASVDFPEPDNPVTTTSLFFGISSETFLRLCRRALRMMILGFIFLQIGAVLRGVLFPLYNPGVPVEALKTWFAIEDERQACGVSPPAAVDGGVY